MEFLPSSEEAIAKLNRSGFKIIVVTSQRGLLPDIPLSDTLLEDAGKGAPSNAAYRYHLGMAYRRLNDMKKARIELEKSIRIDPQAPSAEKASRALSELSES